MARTSRAATGRVRVRPDTNSAGPIGKRAFTNGGSPAQPMLLHSGYQGANSSPNRGYLYWPTVDTRRELSTYSDKELRRRIHWLYGNFGFARRLVNGMSKLIGFLTPVPNTADEDWNELASNNFMNRAGSAEVFDRSGKFDFFTSQLQVNRNRFKDGRQLGLLTETQGGGARLAFYEAHQLGNGGKATGPEWVDGVHLDRFGKHLGYNLRDGERLDEFHAVDARDAVYFGNFESFGQVHGLSILAHAVTNMIDVVETRGFLKHSIKISAERGFVVEQDMGHTLQLPGGGLLGPIVQTEETLPDGTVQEVNWEIATGSGSIPALKPGQRVRTIVDDRPSTSQAEFERALLDDCILGTDLPPAALYYVAGMTGPEVRFTMDEIRRWILIQQYQTAKRWCNRYYVYHLAKEFKAGRLPYPQDPEWWKVEWIGQSDLTIDKGRDGNLSILQLDTGQATWADHWGQSGAFWKRKLMQRILEVAWAARKCEENGLTYADVFGGLQAGPGRSENPEPFERETEGVAK